MSEFFITGKPRGGKTFLAVKYLYQVLLSSDERPIMTNLPLRLDAIARSLKEDLALDYLPDLTKRILVLDEAQTGEFWLHGMDKEGNHIEFLQRKHIKMRTWAFSVPDFEKRGNVGGWYIIDEVHVYFPAAFGSVKDSDDDLRFFLSQHGKMGLDIIFITQHVEQTSKILRRLAQEYMHVRNLSREPVWGFRIANMFRYARSLNSPASVNPVVFERGFEAMDFKKYGAMYDTTAGVGIVGTFVREPEVRGRSLWWLLIIPPIFFLCMYWFVFRAPADVNRAIASMSKHVKEKFASTNMANLNPMVSMLTLPNVTSRNKSEVVVQDTNVFCVGYCVLDGVGTVYLSDGSQHSTDTGEVWLISRTRVNVMGTVYSIKLNTSLTNVVSMPVQSFVLPQVREEFSPSVTVLPAIHDVLYDVPKTPRLNGISSMNSVQQGGY